MKKRILITGAAGFIGFHLAKYLHKRGDHVIGYDNFNDYYTPQFKRDRQSLLKDLRIEIIEGDICNPQLLLKTLEDQEITHIVHLAAQAGVRYSLSNPQAYVKSNIEGFINVLEACRTYPSIKLVYASSSSVYGLNEKIPFSESDRTDQQASIYGVTKKTNELLAFTYHHLYQIPSTGLRFFTVYGPWGRPDMSYFLFTKAILAGKPIELYNEGQMIRDFTYVDDIIRGTAAAVDLEAKCELFNLGNHKPVELLYFIGLLEKALGKEAIKKLLPMQKGDVRKTYADIEHGQKLLNFEPKVSLEEGLVHFVDWYRQYVQ
jgi:UDP-glucuronate 4-epimerase